MLLGSHQTMPERMRSPELCAKDVIRGMHRNPMTFLARAPGRHLPVGGRSSSFPVQLHCQSCSGRPVIAATTLSCPPLSPLSTISIQWQWRHPALDAGRRLSIQ